MGLLLCLLACFTLKLLKLPFQLSLRLPRLGVTFPASGTFLSTFSALIVSLFALRYDDVLAGYRGVVYASVTF
jgi:hypothetical protein